MLERKAKRRVTPAMSAEPSRNKPAADRGLHEPDVGHGFSNTSWVSILAHAGRSRSIATGANFASGKYRIAAGAVSIGRTFFCPTCSSDRISAANEDDGGDRGCASRRPRRSVINDDHHEKFSPIPAVSCVDGLASQGDTEEIRRGPNRGQHSSLKPRERRALGAGA